MSIWTSRRNTLRGALGVVLCTLLGACLAEIPASGASGAKPQSGQRSFALASAVIVPETLRAKGPEGFCVDRRSLKAGRTGGFALLAPCAALDTRAEGLGLETAILTIQAQPKSLVGNDTSAEALAEAFAEEEPVYLENGDGISLIQLARGGAQPIPNGDAKHWRGALMINGYLVGLAVYAEKGGAAAGEAGKDLMLEFAEAVLGASPIVAAE